MYAAAAEKALVAARDFNDFLKDKLSAKTSDWRLGKEKYAKKFALVLASGRSPEDLLAAAEADLKTVRAEMAKLAAPKTVEQALADVARQHPTPDTYIATAKEELAQATAFVKQKDLLTLPARSNLEVIETPEFMRGIYGVGGFNPAPPLEPQLGAFYWITPIPKDWPPARIESKLREYNDYGLQELTIHEAMPGPLRATRIRQRRAAGFAPAAADHLCEHPVCGRMGRVHAADDVGRGLPRRQ